jgi:hypothetical protein
MAIWNKNGDCEPFELVIDGATYSGHYEDEGELWSFFGKANEKEYNLLFKYENGDKWGYAFPTWHIDALPSTIQKQDNGTYIIDRPENGSIKQNGKRFFLNKSEPQIVLTKIGERLYLII